MQRAPRRTSPLDRGGNALLYCPAPPNCPEELPMGLSEFSLITLITFLLGAGGGDLLDYVPSDAYWKAKEVTITLDVLTKDLRPTPLAEVADLVGQLDSPDAAVRDAAA